MRNGAGKWGFRPGRGGGLSPSKPKGGTRSGSSRKGNRKTACDMAGSKQVEQLGRGKYTVYPREVMVVHAAEATEHEVQTCGITPARITRKSCRPRSSILPRRRGTTG